MSPVYVIKFGENEQTSKYLNCPSDYVISIGKSFYGRTEQNNYFYSYEDVHSFNI